MEGEGRYTALSRRRVEKLRRILVMKFGALALQSIDEEVKAAEELFRRCQEDFAEVLKILTEKVAERVRVQEVIAPREVRGYSDLSRFQCDAFQLHRAQEVVNEARKKQQYREELQREIQRKHLETRRWQKAAEGGECAEGRKPGKLILAAQRSDCGQYGEDLPLRKVSLHRRQEMARICVVRTNTHTTAN